MEGRPICVTGMHRSNTSMLAQMLAKCGVYVGPPELLIPAEDDRHNEIERAATKADNPDGYWEDARFVSLNDRILGALGGSHDAPPFAFAGWEDSVELTDLRAEARALVESNAGQPVWGWKDPRSCVTLPFWRSLVPGMRVVYCVRDPREVAQSFAKRSLGTLPPEEAMTLWQTYATAFLEGVGDTPWLATHNSCYFADPASELRRVLDFLEIEPDAESFAEAVAVVKPKLHRSKAPGGEGLPADVAATYASLTARCGPNFEALASEGETPPPTLDEALAQLASLQGFVAEKARAARFREHQVNALTGERLNMLAELTTLKEEREVTLPALHALQEERARVLSEKSALLDDRHRMLDERRQHLQTISDLHSQLLSVTELCHEMQGRLLVCNDALVRAASEQERLNTRLGELEPYSRWIKLMAPAQKLYLRLKGRR